LAKFTQPTLIVNAVTAATLGARDHYQPGLVALLAIIELVEAKPIATARPLLATAGAAVQLGLGRVLPALV